MLLHVAYAIALVFGTTFIHTGCTIAVLGWLRTRARHHWALRSSVTRAIVLAGLVLLMSLAGYLESMLWAGFYWGVGALPEFREALYFSLVTFTTLGYGDVTLDDEWRLLDDEWRLFGRLRGGQRHHHIRLDHRHHRCRCAASILSTPAW
jgi:hypothetical protein